METLGTILFVIVITALFAIGGKIAIYFKNREIALIKEKYEHEISTLRHERDSQRAELSEDLVKNSRRIEEAFKAKLDEKDEQIRTLMADLESLKSWKEEMGLKLAEFKGASQGNPQLLIFKLLEHNQKLNKALVTKWESIEKRLCEELAGTIAKLKKLFLEAENLHRDGLEIISIYESRIPDDLKRKVHDELLKLPDNSNTPLLK